MAQDGTTAGGASYTLDNVTFPVGRTKLQSIFDAIRSTNKGNTAPDLVAGQFWIDDNTPSTTVWTLYFYDGTDSIQFATIDTINNTVNFTDSAFDLVVDTTPQLGGDLDTNGNDINFGDNDKALFGDSDDLQIFHNSADGKSIIKETGTGSLEFRGTNIEFKDSNNTEVMATFTTDGACSLSHNGSTKIATTSTGVNVTGTVVSDGLTVDTDTLYVDSTNNRVGIGTSSPSHELEIHSSSPTIELSDADDNYISQITQSGSGFFITSDINGLGSSSMRFRVNGNTERMRINSSGYLGIGTTTINANLSVYDSSTADDLTLGVFWSPPAISGETQSLIKIIKSSSDTTSAYGGAIGGYLSQGVGSGLTLNTLNGGTLTEIMRLQHNGNVGIGTSSPDEVLHISGADGTLRIQNSTTTSNGDAVGKIEFESYNNNVNAMINNEQSGGTSGGELVFSTRPFAGTLAERMRIDSSGKVGIGTSSPDRPLDIESNVPAVRLTDTNVSGLYHEILGDGTSLSIEADDGNAGASSSINFKVDGSEAMRIDSVRDLGVGLSSTIRGKIHAKGYYFKDSESTLVIESEGGAQDRPASLTFMGTFDAGITDNSPRRVADIVGGFDGGTWGNEFLSFNVGINAGNDSFLKTTERMRIDGSGNVGIGTSSPSAKLDVTGTDGAVEINSLGTQIAYTYDGFNYLTASGASATLQIQASGTSGKLTFVTNASERMRIDSSGSVIIGATSTPDGSSGGIGFIAESNSRKTLITASTTTSDTTLVVFRNPNGTVGGINTSGSSTAFNTSSDYRLKENVVDITDATTRLKQLSPKRFNFISDADTTVDGFLAHEVSDIVPEAITGTKDEVDADGNPEYQGIDQSKLVPLLVATIKELEARITALET